MQNKNPNMISWMAPEYRHYEKTFLWHLSYIILFTALISYAVYTKSLLTIITFSVLGIIGWTFSNKKPKNVNYRLKTTGIILDRVEIPYKNIKSFWIIYNPPLEKSLNLETTAYLNHIVTMELGNQDPLEVKKFLQNYLMEDLDRQETITDMIAKKIKF